MLHISKNKNPSSVLLLRPVSLEIAERLKKIHPLEALNFFLWSHILLEFVAWRLPVLQIYWADIWK